MSWNNVIPDELLLDLINNTPVQMDLFETVVEFEINEEYLTSVPISWKMIDSHGKNYGTSSVVDHPSFSALRDVLERKGFIKTERNWHNGDTVISDFKLNGELFKDGEQFSCAGALGRQLRVQRRLSISNPDND